MLHVQVHREFTTYFSLQTRFKLTLKRKSLSHFQIMNLCRDFKTSTYYIYVISDCFLSSRCQKLPWIGSLCHNYNPDPSPFSRILTRVTALMTLVEHYLPSRSTSVCPHLSRARVAPYCFILFWRPLFVFLSVFIWSLHCLSLDIRVLITPLVNSNF